MARKIAQADRDTVLAAAREAFATDRYVKVELEGGAELRVSMMTSTRIAVMPAGASSYTRMRSGGGRETLGVHVRAGVEGNLHPDELDVATAAIDTVIRRAYAAVASYAAVAA